MGLRRKWSGEGEVQKSIVLTHWLVKAKWCECFFSFLLFLHSGSNSRTAVECVYDENTKSSQAYHQVTICKCSPYAYLDFHLFSLNFVRPRRIMMRAHRCTASMPPTASLASLCRWTDWLASGIVINSTRMWKPIFICQITRNWVANASSPIWRLWQWNSRALRWPWHSKRYVGG